MLKKSWGKNKKKSAGVAQAPQGPRAAMSDSGRSEIREITLVNNEIFIQNDQGDSTPLLTNKKLSIEITDEARCQIARKIARLLPELANAKKLELLEYTERVLEALCKDQLVRVRRILAQELKDYEDAPRKLITTLAWDDELEVSRPVLECSPVLTDQDLIDIISATKIPGVANAIAKRPRLSSKVSGAIVKSGFKGAVTSLLDNKNADISPKSYDRIAKDAPDVEMWHEPLMLRPDLPSRTMNKLAGFVSESLVIRLREQDMISRKTAKGLLKEIHKRLENPTVDNHKNAAEKAQDLYELGELDSEIIDDAVCRKDKGFVYKSLSLLSGYPVQKVGRMVESGNPKVITGLCWKAGVSMRVSMQIQLRMARVHHTKMLHAKGGKDYPLQPEEMEFYLDLFQD